jgi:hypothetical protein
MTIYWLNLELISVDLFSTQLQLFLSGKAFNAGFPLLRFGFGGLFFGMNDHDTQ